LYNLIIVEDEYNIKKALVRFVKWQEIGFNVVQTFENGKDALEYAGSNRVDAVLTDIRMPVMDGIELIKEMSTSGCCVKFVVLSGYDDFSYAQQSIHYGVFEYVLKPVKFELLSEIFIKLKAEMDREQEGNAILNEALSLKKEQFLNNLVKGSISDKNRIFYLADELGMNIKAETYCIARIEIDSFYENDRTAEDRNLLKSSVRGVLESFMEKHRIGYMLSNDIPEFCILALNIHDSGVLTKLLEEFADQVTRCTSQKVSIGVSQIYDSVFTNDEPYKEAGKCLEYKFFSEKSEIICAPIRQPSNSTPILLSDSEIEEIIERIKDGDMQRIDGFIRSKFALIQDSGCIALEDIYFLYVQLIIILQRYFKNMGKSIDLVLSDNEEYRKDLKNYKSISEVMKFVLFLFEKSVDYQKTSGKTKRKVIERAEEYVREHFNENINLNDISQYIYMNPSYFSRLFKSETGENFVDFLSRIRVEKSMELLQNSNLHVYEISNMVGYNDYRYFSKIFKRFTGITPAEYRDSK